MKENSNWKKIICFISNTLLTMMTIAFYIIIMAIEFFALDALLRPLSIYEFKTGLLLIIQQKNILEMNKSYGSLISVSNSITFISSFISGFYLFYWIKKKIVLYSNKKTNSSTPIGPNPISKFKLVQENQEITDQNLSKIEMKELIGQSDLSSDSNFIIQADQNFSNSEELPESHSISYHIINLSTKGEVCFEKTTQCMCSIYFILFFLLIFMTNQFLYAWSPLTNFIPVAFETALIQATINPVIPQYSKTRKIPNLVRQIPREDQPNIVLIMSDSLGTNYLTSIKGKEKTPFINQLLAENDTYLFDQAIGVSGATDTAGPGILSGASMIASEDKKAIQEYIDLPTLSGMARSIEYDTMTFSSCITHFDNDLWPIFMHQLKESNEIYSPSTMKKPLTNEFGMDDRISVDKFREIIKERGPNAKPFYALLYFTNQHYPYIINNDTYIEPRDGSSRKEARYWSSLEITDYLVKHVVETLKMYGLYDRTVLTITADHGDLPGEKVDRTYNPTWEILSVPLWFHIPNVYMPSTSKKEIFQMNRNRPAMTTDILFTLAEILGFENLKSNNSHIFSGESLFEVKSTERIRIGYQGPPFFTDLNYHILLSNSTHCLRIFKNIMQSPTILERSANQYNKTETTFYWGDLTHEQKKYWKDIIDSIPVIKEKAMGKVNY